MKTLRELTTTLGLDEGDVGRAAVALDDATPWYVTWLSGFGTWVGATLLGIAMGLLMIVELGIGGRLVTLEDWIYVLLIYGGSQESGKDDLAGADSRVQVD